MAIIKCPNCGKEISDRSEKCIFCNAVLPPAAREILVPPEVKKQNIKAHMIRYILAAVSAFAVSYLIGVISAFILSMYGENTKNMIMLIISGVLPKAFLFTILGAVLFSLFYLLLPEKPVIHHITQAASCILTTMLFWLILNDSAENPAQDVPVFCESYGLWYGLSFPLLQGALSFLFASGKKILRMILSVLAYVVLSVVLCMLAVRIPGTGASELAIVQFSAAVTACAVSFMLSLVRT